MRIIDEILQKIEYSIVNDTYIDLENGKVEIKDNSNKDSDWNEVLKTVNAFLNTDGGIIIVGIKEDIKNKKYQFQGYDSNMENRFKTIVLNPIFTDETGTNQDIHEYIKFETPDFGNGRVLVIFVDSLNDSDKYLFYKGVAYERLMTGDHKIPASRIEAQKEYKSELINASELKLVTNSKLDDLDVNRLNDYIQLLNREVKMENIKPSMDDALPFLFHNGMIRDHVPTILGILVCGKNPGEHLHWASQVDAYVDVPGALEITRNKKNINGTVLELMSQSESFVIRNIQTGVSAEKGGTKTFEYPEKLIRECINNSLAHRDYSINHYININIVPEQHIEIRNPGRFKSQLVISYPDHSIPVRRIIPNNPKANNPRLAKILGVYSKWEGKGYGMATVIGACLEDKIDVPYYKFHSRDDLSLYIPKGNLVDENMETLFESYSGYILDKLESGEITTEQKRILSYFYKSEKLNKQDKYTILLTKDNNHLKAIESLQDARLIYRHEVSDDFYSVFILDRNLFRKSFAKELNEIFGKEYKNLTEDYKNVLSFIYEKNNYSISKYPSANETGSKLWIKNGNTNKLEGYESYKRKVRNIINSLEKNQFITRHNDKYEYIVNTNFKPNTNLFS